MTIGIEALRQLRLQPAVMKILVSDPAFVDDLVSFLRRCECSADRIGAQAIEAMPPHSTQELAYLRMELDAYLRVWREMHPDAKAELLETAATAG